MKKTIKLNAMRSIAGIIALAAVIGFSTAACSVPGGGGDLVGTVTIDITSPRVGNTLTATFSGNGSGTGTAMWQWLANGTAISNTNSNTYKVVITDFDKKLQARISYSDRDGSVTSNETAPVTE